PAAHEPAVGLELRLARTAQADAALLALEVGPAADEPRGEMLVLRELDLELTFERRGSLREDVEDQTVAVEDSRLERDLEIALLSGFQRLVDEDELRVRRPRAGRDLFDLAAADEVFRIGTIASRLNFGYDFGSGGLRERAELLGLVLVTGTVQANVEQKRAFATARTIKQPCL